jgi:Ca2+/H+ antiporter, TMEM165/GDT1 family
VNEALTYLAVLVAAAIPWLEVLLVVPAGILAGLPWGPTVAVAAVGNVATLVPVVVAADRLESWWRRRSDTAPAADGEGGEDGGVGRQGRARRLLDRYGVPGLAVLGPLLTGAHLAAAVAMAAGADRRRALVWFVSGVVAWALLAGVLTILGVGAFAERGGVPDLIPG